MGLGCVHMWVMEGGTFSSLPHTARIGEVWILRSSTWDMAARFGTLNSNIPSLSEVA